MSPGISIITPVYNGMRFIADCIENVIAQQCPSLEHIIVDGGSTDGTVEVIRQYAEKFPHIRWISEKDRGQSDAMNRGVAMAHGAIIGFLNVDDFYEPGALREVLELFGSLPEPALLVGNCNVWDNDGKLWFVSRPKLISLKNLLLGKYMEAFPLNASAYFYHKSLHQKIGDYEVEEHFGMDVHFILKAVQHAHVAYVDRTWGNFRFIEGAKTYENDKNGASEQCMRRITEQYRRQQPLPYRFYLATIQKRAQIMSRLWAIYGRLKALLSGV